MKPQEIFEVNLIRKDFPQIETKINNHNLIYFDNGATTLKPKTVVDSILEVYSSYNSSPHSQHFLAQKVTQEIESARQKVAEFLNVEASEIVFTKGATESINLVSQTFLENSKAYDEIILTDIEHHANLVPWQVLAKRKKFKIRIWKAEKDGTLDPKKLESLITRKTKLISVSHVSNVLGIINPVSEIVCIAHNKNVPVLIDGTQAVSHFKVDLKKIGADFYVFSGHKIFSGTGIGVLFGKKDFLKKMPPYQTGGEMVESVSLTKTSYQESPYKFEAGTINFEAIIGLKRAICYFQKILLKKGFYEHEKKLKNHLEQKLEEINGINILGKSKSKIPLFSFYFKDINPLDLASFLDLKGIALRAGKHCAEPLHKKFGINYSLRVSLSFYNTIEEIDYFIENLQRGIKFLKKP